MRISESSTKSRAVPNAADNDKDEHEVINTMGHAERVTKKKGEPSKRVLNELDPENTTEIGEPLRIQEFAMRQSRITETVQDVKGVSGDFMTSMGGKTDRLGAKLKNTGGFDEFGQSTSGSPEDGITSHIADLDLKTKQKNTGGFDEFGDSESAEATDGITKPMGGMGSELGQNSSQKNKGGQFEPVRGSKNRMSEDWSVGNIASIMEGDDVNLQELFDTYAGQNTYVCLEDFQQICRAHGVIVVLTEQNLEAFLDASQRFMFYEGCDAGGRFWQPHPLEEMMGAGDVVDAPVAGQRKGALKRSDPTKGHKAMELAEVADPIDGTEDDTLVGGKKLSRPSVQMDEEDPEIDAADAGLHGEMPMGGDIDMPMGDADDMPMGDEITPAGPGAGLEGGDELADVFQQIGDDFTRAADLIAGHDEASEMPDDEASEGDVPMGDEGEEEAEFGDEEDQTEEECSMGEDLDIGDEAADTSRGDMMSRIGDGVQGKATSTKMRGRDEDEKQASVDKSKPQLKLGEKVPTESNRHCRRCGSGLDKYGCPACALMRESEDLKVTAGGEFAKANKDGYLTSDATKSGQGKLDTATPPADTSESTSGDASDGITKEVEGKQTPLKPKIKNTGGQAAFKGGSGTMKENVLRLAKVAKEGIAAGARKIGRAGKYATKFVVATEGMKPTIYNLLAEALASVEELMQAYGSKAVMLEARYFLPHQKQLIYKHRLPLANIKRRDPIVSEGKILFRTAKVANDFADCVVNEGSLCRVKNHNWGAAVDGAFDWDTAQKAFRTINEVFGTQVRSPAMDRLAGRRGGGGDPANKMRSNSLGIGGEELDSFPGEDPYEGGGLEDGEESEEPNGDEYIPGGYNPEAPGAYDPEGQLCPSCGNAESPDENGICPECGQERSGGSTEVAFGGQEDPNLADADFALDAGAHRGGRMGGNIR